MSTTFAVHRHFKNIKLEDDYLPDYYTYDDESFIEIAFRGNGTGMRWLKDSGKFLSDDIQVYPLDNSAQGIYTIGDIKKEINNK